MAFGERVSNCFGLPSETCLIAIHPLGCELSLLQAWESRARMRRLILGLAALFALILGVNYLRGFNWNRVLSRNTVTPASTPLQTVGFSREVTTNQKEPLYRPSPSPTAPPVNPTLPEDDTYDTNNNEPSPVVGSW